MILQVVDVVRSAGQIAGLAVLAAAVAAGVAALYRWYARERAPRHPPLLVALAAVAGYLNVKTALGQAIVGETDVLTPAAAVFNAVALVAAVVAAPAGSRVGDRLAIDLVATAGAREVDRAVSPLVRAVGRVVTVTLPDEIADIEGYDPAQPATKEALAGTTLAFPKGVTVDELRDRLVARLREEYEVGHVDIEMTEDGEVTYLAVGDRVAGLGATLAPGAAAVAVSADPAYTASAGDVVQLWAGDAPERVATAEIRAVVGDTVTLAVDAQKAPDLAGGEYRLVTLPAQPRPETEFAGLLRAADETMGAVHVAAGSPLVGLPVGAVDATVTAVRPADGDVEPIPARTRPLAAGDTVYVVTRPETIRRLEAQAGG